MDEDKEITAMADISKALGDLDDEARARVIRWAAERYGVHASGKRQSGISSGGLYSNNNIANDFEDIASMYDAANPKTDAEKALVLGYWYQKIEEKPEFGSQEVNTQLKHLGHGVTNITSALSDLINRKPRLAIQVQKSGKTKQARKKYKITNEGIKFVEHKLLMGDDES